MMKKLFTKLKEVLFLNETNDDKENSDMYELSRRNDLETLFNDTYKMLNDIFNCDLFNGNFYTSYSTAITSPYNFNIVDDNIVVPMPGFNKEDISVKVEGNILRIFAEGEHEITHEKRTARYSFDISSKEVESVKYVNGELIITFKKNEEKPKESVKLEVQ